MGNLTMTEVEEGCEVGMKVPDFSCLAFHNNGFDHFELSSLKGKWILLIFYPVEFGFGLSELIDIQVHKDDRVAVVGGITGKCFWTRAPFENLCIKGVDFPIVEDLNLEIFRKYNNNGYHRRYFLVCPEGLINQASATYDLPIEIGIKQCLRGFYARMAGPTPPGWITVGETMVPITKTQSMLKQEKPKRLSLRRKRIAVTGECSSNVITTPTATPSEQATASNRALSVEARSSPSTVQSTG